MNALSGMSRCATWPICAVSNVASGITLSSRMLAVAGMVLMGLSTTAAAPLQRRYDGGLAILQPDFSSLKPLVPLSGPFYAPEFACQFKHRLDGEGKSFPNISSFFDLRIVKDSMQIDDNSESLRKVPADFLPYQDAVEKMGPSCVRGAARFPENLSAFMNVGRGLIENGNKACSIKDPRHYTECVKTAALVRASISMRSMDKKFETEAMGEESYRGRGMEISLGDKSVFFGLNPEIHTNYRLALTELEDKFLGDHCFFRKESKEILEFVKGIHKILVNNLPALSKLKEASSIPGIFRKNSILVFKESAENAEKELKELYRKQGEPGKVVRIKNIFWKLRMELPLSHEESAMISSVIYLPPFNEDVEKHMHGFAEKFKEYASLDVHPVALAAWVHMQIANIQPFIFGNGRLARLFVNAILVRGGYESLIFLNYDHYVEAILNDRETSGAFASYLAKQISRQAHGPQLLIGAAHV